MEKCLVSELFLIVSKYVELQVDGASEFNEVHVNKPSASHRMQL